MHTKTAKLSFDLVPEIIGFLEADEVIILPTDTSYALVANALSRKALAKISELKQWDSPQPLAIFTRKEKASEFGVISSSCEKLMEHFPYPVTMIIPKKNTLPDEVTASYDSLLVVCPDEFVYQLIDRVPFPMAGTSASLSSELKATSFEMALYLYEGKVPLIIDGGKSKYARSGTLIDFTVEFPTILKFGPVSVDDMRPIIPEIILASHLMK